MIVPDPNMFGGSVYVCKNLGDPWKEYKTNKMPWEKLILDHKVLEQMSLQQTLIIEELV